jgi:hypothetical protein
VDPVAKRCAIQKSEIGMIKAQLDHELGRRRWTCHRPMLTRKRDSWRLLRRNDFRPG